MMGRRAAKQITRVRILLRADGNQSGGNWLDKERYGDRSGCWIATVERMRRRFVELRLDALLVGQPGGRRQSQV